MKTVYIAAYIDDTGVVDIKASGTAHPFVKDAFGWMVPEATKPLTCFNVRPHPLDDSENNLSRGNAMAEIAAWLTVGITGRAEALVWNTEAQDFEPMFREVLFAARELE